MDYVRVLLEIGLNWIGLSFIRAGTDRIVDVTQVNVRIMIGCDWLVRFVWMSPWIIDVWLDESLGGVKSWIGNIAPRCWIYWFVKISRTSLFMSSNLCH